MDEKPSANHPSNKPVPQFYGKGYRYFVQHSFISSFIIPSVHVFCLFAPLFQFSSALLCFAGRIVSLAAAIVEMSIVSHSVFTRKAAKSRGNKMERVVLSMVLEEDIDEARWRGIWLLRLHVFYNDLWFNDN